MATMIVETGAVVSGANSYCSVDDADDYHERRLHVSDWTSATDDTKEAALMWATSLLDNLLVWNGYRYSDDQELEWPRDSVYDMAGDEIATDTIPQFLKDATAEYARNLIAEDLAAPAATSGFRTLSAGSLSLEVNKLDRKPVLPDSVWYLVRYYARKRGDQVKILARA